MKTQGWSWTLVELLAAALISTCAVRATHAQASSPPAEAFTILFPVDFQSLSAARSTADLDARLEAMLVPLQRVLSENAFRQLMELAAAPDNEGEGSPPSNLIFGTFGAGFAKIPLDHWFVVSMRLSPCSDVAPLRPDDAKLREVICRPQVRLVAQPFGLVPMDGRDKTQALADDKSLHLSFDYVEGLSPEQIQAIDAAERHLLGSTRVRDPSQGPGLANDVNTHYTPEIRAALEKSRMALVECALRLADSAQAGALRIPYGAPGAIPRYRDFIANDLTSKALPRVITQNFALNGFRPGTAETWVFASYPSQRKLGLLMSNELTIFRKENLDFMAVDYGRAVVQRGVVKMNKTENFIPHLNSTASLDLALMDWMNSHPEAQTSMVRTYPFGDFIKITNGHLISNPVVQWNPTEVKASVSESLRWVYNPARSNLFTQPCSSCHSADLHRELHNLKGVGESQIPGNRPTVEFPVAPRVSTTFNWNFHLLSYFLSAPAIGSRVVQETQADLNWVRAHKK